MSGSLFKKFRLGVGATSLSAVITAFTVSSATARHQWDDLHWALPNGQTSLTISLQNCQDNGAGYYNSTEHFSDPNGDWNTVIGASGGVINIDGSAGCNEPNPGSDPLLTFDSRIAPYDWNTDTTATARAYNSDYGDTGWVGIAIVEVDQSADGNHITYGEVY